MSGVRPLRHVVWVNEIAAPVGGCETYVLSTARHLRARGIKATLLYDPRRPTTTGFLRTFDAAFPLVDPASQIRSLAPDLVYVHRLTGARAIRAMVDGGRPVVRFFHDHRLFCLREHKYTTTLHQTCSKPLGPSCWMCLGFVRRTERWPHIGYASLSALRDELAANRSLRAFVVGSTYMADHVALHGFVRNHVHVVPLYTDPPVDGPAVDREPDLVVFLGQLVRGKGVDVLLDAFARLRTLSRLAIVGTGRQEQELRKQAAHLRIAERVDFMGAQDAVAKASYLRRAALVAVPSRTAETFALVGPEAMSHGTPVVASCVGGVGEWLQDGVTGIAVAPNDPAALAKGIERVLSDRELATRLGEASRIAYRAHFLPEHHVASLQDVLTNTMREAS